MQVPAKWIGLLRADVVSDKRLLTLETEYASVLHAIARDSSTLSTRLRQAWDSGVLQTMTDQLERIHDLMHVIDEKTLHLEQLL